MCVLYAFMRRTDDLSDDPTLDVTARSVLLEQWQSSLAAALRGEDISCSILPAMADVAIRRQLPHEYLHEAIRGVQGDLVSRTFETFPELEHYCYQVAGVVGLSCLSIWGYEGEEPRELATACGTAFQLTNILRDLKEDAGNGRIYLPQQELREFSYTPADLLAGNQGDAFRELMQFQVQRAWSYYDQALPLRHRLSPDGKRIFVGLFNLYSSLLKQIERANYDVYSRRIRVPFWTKANIALNCLLRREPVISPEPLAK